MNIIKSLTESKKNIFFLLIAVSILMRFISFYPSVLDHDESTYMIIGRDILNGKALYTDVTDTKPAGIFLVYAGLEFLFGSSIFFKRLAFAIFVSITAYLIFLLALKIIKNKRAALASGFIYIFYTSIWTYHGLSPNTELLFNLTTAGGLLLFLDPKIKNFFWGGLMMGTGFIIKYLVLFDLAAFMLFFFTCDITGNPQIIREPRFWGRYLMAAAGFIIPFGLVNLWFWESGNFHDFYFITYVMPANYANDPSLLRYLVMLLDFTAKFLPISFLVFYVIFKRDKPFSVKNKYFFSVWIIFILLAIYMPGREYSHYTIQLMLPLSILAGLFFHPEFIIDKITAKIYTGRTGIIALACAILIIQSVTFINEIVKPDYPREVAEIIKKELKPGDKVFVSNYEHIIYYILGMDSPTKFVHSGLLFGKYHKAFNIDATGEIKRIINSNPRFVVVERKNNIVDGLLLNKYKLIKKFRNGEIKLYKRI